jgi:phage shock protein PspC (stress-responsive transcriptional regulator)
VNGTGIAAYILFVFVMNKRMDRKEEKQKYKKDRIEKS